MNLNSASLHYYIMKHFVEFSTAPQIEKLSTVFGVARQDVIDALKMLQDDHGVVLHPVSSEVWVMHPFSAAPTNFWIQSGQHGWWGNCAWCSLGAAALLDRDLTITTTLGSESKQVNIEIKDGNINNDNLYIHFPIPMEKAWDNVIYTCSTMLMFESKSDIEQWCARHGLVQGDVQPISHIWEFSKVWYGNHLNPDWVKWSVAQAAEIFERFNLAGPIWHLPVGPQRF
ncbi:alkylmercury lyase family protein [Pseudoalteromonas sp. Of7M-16]|uniref:alkylmercury lyase family protein n=1 Tax=Pseudoalteromonas sp. Of7M-16 TaxID=2917756 RepID=UPI001EF680D5|nr:alkylmercury lyase family protein [Pseudoalteromonas sp. Of7M-16]MCG7551528.1 alkylmercury lyase family protein [Pseudoalteromonas sp. Of7M-16]